MERETLIKTIEETRHSKLIIYITGDRQPFATRIAEDVIPIFDRHLKEFNHPEKISLFLYTRGGDMITPIRLVKLIRSYCKKFEVLIPYKAHSAGTLISLGANIIVMGVLGELSPVDPSTGHPFNPQNPINPQERMEISVEDLNSYFLLAKEKAEVRDNQMIEVYKQLVEKIHPLSLGNAYRAIRMARQLSEKLLKIHIKNERTIKKIVQAITGDICIHGYPITRDEIKELGLEIEKPDDELEKNMWDLYESYSKKMELSIPFNSLEILKDKEKTDFEYTGSCIESKDQLDQFIFNGEIKKEIQNNKAVINMNIKSQSWIKIR